MSAVHVVCSVHCQPLAACTVISTPTSVSSSGQCWTGKAYISAVLHEPGARCQSPQAPACALFVVCKIDKLQAVMVALLMHAQLSMHATAVAALFRAVVYCMCNSM